MVSQFHSSPAISFVGRHNSGKTTLVVRLIRILTERGYDIGSIKHHGHRGFDIDIPGKDSYRHREAGARETVIASPDKLAIIKTLTEDANLTELVDNMPGHDLVIVEGYRKSGIPTIEIMRGANERDVEVARAFLAAAKAGAPLSTDFVQKARALDVTHATNGDETPTPSAAAPDGTPTLFADLTEKMPVAQTVAIVTDIPEAREAAALYHLDVFDPDDAESIADYLIKHYVRPRVTVVIQAGGESRRMGQSKALVPFAGRPLIMRLVERVAPVADELIITTNEAEKLEFLHEVYPKLNIRLVKDLMDVRGALPGLTTALTYASHEYVACVACDMVFASAALIAEECRVMKKTGSDVVVPVNKHGFEPFHATYKKSSCLLAAKAALEKGEQKVQSLYTALDVYELPQSRVLEVEPMGGCFVNVNTPQELAQIERDFMGA